jgi:hypothetical protein
MGDMHNTVLNYDNAFGTILGKHTKLPLELIEMAKTYYYMEKEDNGYEIKYGYTIEALPNRHRDAMISIDEGYFILHNDCDQPAIVSRSGHRWWYQHNKQHRDTKDKNGKVLPAVIINNDNYFYKEWHHNGEFISCSHDYSCKYV